ncbi:MAG TPA: biotin synthase BioB [Myxococcales bacterium]|nr:biotin synthase BioB [Myxococcales bacterium]HIN86031.1 biotin synthase BioB [Myxococcales bacterium]
MSWDYLANRVLEGQPITRDEAMSVLNADDDQLLAVLNAAFRVRERYFGRDVRIHVLQNAKSGVCPEDCSFCSQSLSADSGVERYRMQSVDELVAGAKKAHEMGASTYCMVTATRGPSSNELATVCEAVRRIKEEMPLRVCTSLGILKPEEATQLAEAGVDRFNHNLESSKRFFPEICSTHSWQDRVDTIRAAKNAGMEACCGGIVGMGEGKEDRVAMAFELRELEVESIPINFLDPRPGTPLGERERLSPADCLKTLAMFRLVNPTRDLRVAGGREEALRSQQPLALYVANSIFAEGYLTTGGQGVDSDMAMIRDAGFQVAEVVPG